MSVRLWYIAHQVGAPERWQIDQNLHSMLCYQRELMKAGIHAVAPWYSLAVALDDQVPAQRDASLEVAKGLVTRFDGVMVVGPSWSTGTKMEAQAAQDAGLPVLDLVGWPPPNVARQAMDVWARMTAGGEWSNEI